MNVFISKSIVDCAELEAFCHEIGWSLEAVSFIDSTDVPFGIPAQTEIIFFCSKNGVRTFFEQGKLPKNVVSACIGKEVARILRKNGSEPAFLGEIKADAEQLQMDFQKFVGNRNVFFPVSNAALDPIEKGIPEAQKTIATIHDLKILPQKVNQADVYIFTNPSSVKGFLEMNTFPKNARIITAGLQAERVLMNLDFFPEFVYDKEEELLEYLEAHLRC